MSCQTRRGSGLFVSIGRDGWPSRPHAKQRKAAVRWPPARRAIRLGEASGPYQLALFVKYKFFGELVSHLPQILLLPVLLLLPGCLATQTGGLEVLNPKQAYGQSLAVVGNLHGENDAIEQRLASDLRRALSKRGLTISEDPAKADLVVVPTLGRMRERSPTPVVPVLETASEPVEASEPVIAAPAPEARAFNRFGAANVITRGDLVSRRAVPSARAPIGAQQAGLLLTAYRTKDYQDYGVGRQSLPPVWRIYVSQPARQMKWNSVAAPLINAAAGAAKPLGKSVASE